MSTFTGLALVALVAVAIGQNASPQMTCDDTAPSDMVADSAKSVLSPELLASLEGGGESALGDSIEELGDSISDITNDVRELQGDFYTASSCAELRAKRVLKSGIYSLYSHHKGEVYSAECDMDVEGGGWTVLQKRFDGSVDFDRTWADYKAGFGDLKSEYWLGNDYIHELSTQVPSEVRIELRNKFGTLGLSFHRNWWVDNEAHNYRLHSGVHSRLFSINAGGDSLEYHDNMDFTTKDVDNDMEKFGNCAQSLTGGGWWYNSCLEANLNGVYEGGADYKGIIWEEFDGTSAPLKTSRLMIRPLFFSQECPAGWHGPFQGECYSGKLSRSDFPTINCDDMGPNVVVPQPDTPEKEHTLYTLANSGEFRNGCDDKNAVVVEAVWRNNAWVWRDNDKLLSPQPAHDDGKDCMIQQQGCKGPQFTPVACSDLKNYEFLCTFSLADDIKPRRV